MQWKLLTGADMVTLTSPWVGEYRETFLSIAEIAGLYPKVERAHASVLALKQADRGEEEIAALTEQLTAEDQRFDALVRTLWNALGSNIGYLETLEPPRTEQAGQLATLQRQLMPERLAIVLKSYSEEAGFAAQLVAQLTPELEALLASVPLIGGGNALEVVRAIGVSGGRIGDLARRRGLLQDQVAAGTSDYQYRYAWSQSVGLVLANLEHSDAPAERVALIRNPMLEGLAAAEKRAKARQATAAASGAAAGASSAPASASASAPVEAAAPATSAGEGESVAPA